MAGEEDALLPQSSPRLEAAHKKEHHNLLVNRILIIVALVALVCLGIFFQLEVNGLTGQLAQERARVDDLEKVVHVHEQVIERFNSSVTNSDVMDRLSSLDQDLHDTTHKLKDELHNVQADVSNQLDETLLKLNATVRQAQDVISNQVDKVKKDFEQYVVTTQDQFSMENSFMVYQLAGTFTVLSCLISMWHMTAHLRKMNQPNVQRKILAILWMVPIYAVTSWFSLVFHSAEGYLAIIKDGYEAYVIYQFLSFCIAVLGKGDRNKVVDLLAQHADHLTPPFRLLGIFEVCGCCKPPAFESNRALADAILLQCQAFAMQFVFLRPLTTTAMVVLEQLDYYGAGDGPRDYRAPQFYITIVQNLSIFIAFTGLLKFYHAVDKDLAWCRPFAKFLCIKCVVFMTFWQGLAISILAQTTDVGGQDADEWAKSAQNFLICLEMLLFSIAHFYCFPTEEWEEGYRVKHSQGQFGDSIALGDFFSDLKLILRSNGNTKKKKKIPAIPEGSESSETGDGVSAATSEESTQCLQDDEQMIADALEESLGLAGDDPDIAEAKKRLLESKILSADMFEYGSEQSGSPSASDSMIGYLEDHFDVEAPTPSKEGDVETDGDEGDMEIDGHVEGDNGTDKDNGDMETGDAKEVEESDHEYDPQSGIYSTAEYREDEFFDLPSESTHLLGGATTPSTPLRPSIFTTVAALAEEEGEKEGATDDKKEQV